MIPWYSRYILSIFDKLIELFYLSSIYFSFQPYSYFHLFYLNDFILHDSVDPSEVTSTIIVKEASILNKNIQEHTFKLKTM